MEFEIYIKEKEIYKKMLVEPPGNSGWPYFKSLKLLLEQQLNIIRNDILSYFDDKENVNLICPSHSELKIQAKIDILTGIRKVNMKTKEQLVDLLAIEEFIICENCKSKMYKTPIGVKYNKVGTRFILEEVGNHESIKYVYLCENCYLAVSEVCYETTQQIIKLREELISRGESYLPTKFGFWHWENHNKKTKPVEIQNIKEDDCDHAWKRNFEYIYILNQKNPFVKITDKCVKCEKLIHIK